MKVQAHQCDQCKRLERAEEGFKFPFGWRHLVVTREGHGVDTDIELCSAGCYYTWCREEAK